MLHRAAAATLTVVTGTLLLAAPVAARMGAGPSGWGGADTATRAEAARDCGLEPQDASGWQRLFDAQSGAWAGGDVVTSLRLPDGRLLWMFGDTFVGAVTRAGVRASSTRIVRNSLVVTQGSCVDPLPTASEALPGRGASWLWPTHAAVVDAGASGTSTTVAVFAQRMARTGAGPWDFVRLGTVAVEVAVPRGGTPRVGAVHDLADHGVAWGASLVPDGATTWVYGTRPVAGRLGRELLLARAPTASVTDPSTWDYRTAAGFSRRWQDAVPVRSAADGVSTSPSAAHLGSLYVVVTKAREFLDPDVVALTSAHPWGPWRSTTLFRAPSGGEVLRYSPAIVATSSSRRLVVAVCRTSTSLPLLMARAELAYPTFADVRLPKA